MKKITDLRIRELEERDIETCAEINISTFPWTVFGLTIEGAMKFQYDRLGKDLVFVAELEKEVVGFIAIKKDILFANYIRRIVLREDVRSKGIGSKLIKFIEEKTVKDNLPNVFLLCSTTNEKAIKFYQKNGYKKIGKVENFVDKGLHEYIFWKSFGTINEFNAYD